MKKIFFLFLLPLFATAQITLSDSAEIRVVTCGPYQGELYSAFGHSAFRINDPKNGFDIIFNYGIFDYNQPNFYLNFAKGFMLYKLGVQNYARFKRGYISENRYIHEQILNLDSTQKQAVFDFLQFNSLPENNQYFYDYYYDNCATKIRDVLKESLGDNLVFDGSYIDTEYSLRDLTDIYLEHQPWGDLGIDLCLGLPIDKIATPQEYMFLPDYIEAGFNHAAIIKNGNEKPLVKSTEITYDSTPVEFQKTWNTPWFWFSAVCIIGLILTFIEIFLSKWFRVFDILLFTIVGILGWFFLALWTLTNHTAAYNNLNVLWAVPLHFPIAFILIAKKTKSWVAGYFKIVALLYLLLLILWAWLPQDLHNTLVPLMILLMVRAFLVGRNRSPQNNRQTV